MSHRDANVKDKFRYKIGRPGGWLSTDHSYWKGQESTEGPQRLKGGLAGEDQTFTREMERVISVTVKTHQLLE